LLQALGLCGIDASDSW